jgi:hypothetical protein
MLATTVKQNKTSEGYRNTSDIGQEGEMIIHV